MQNVETTKEDSKEQTKLFENPKEIIKKMISKRKEFFEKLLNDPDLKYQDQL